MFVFHVSCLARGDPLYGGASNKIFFASDRLNTPGLEIFFPYHIISYPGGLLYRETRKLLFGFNLVGSWSRRHFLARMSDALSWNFPIG